MRCFILGSGSWGTALASILAAGGHEVTIWCRRSERAAEIDSGEHSLLPGCRLGEGIRPVTAVECRREEYDLAISALPTQRLREVLNEHGQRLPLAAPWVSASKGVELESFLLPSQVLQECGVTGGIGILSGPSHAEEVAAGVPTAVVLGHSDVEVGRWMQERISTESFRVYLNSDPVGVEWGGALKNVIALASGIAIGCGFGDNTLAALVTRGAVEMARLGVALGGRQGTFSGLSGIGDLIVTCFSEHSRNRSVGVRIGRGEDPRAVLDSMVQVAEGTYTSRAVVEMCRSLGVEMPIAEEVHLIVHRGKDVERGTRALLSRSLKEE
ncbi:MAG: NAD(P)H-dependent glycerol-3-phosphate dehydrogenase [Planctomycetota bacterium]